MAAKATAEFFAGKRLRVGIIARGYAGLPLALRFADASHQMTSFDTDPFKVNQLNAGESYIQHVSAEKIKAQVDAKHLDATTDFAKLRDVDAVPICVPTPLDERREPDLS